MTDQQPTIAHLTGLARKKMFATLMKRINEGGRLTATEIKFMREYNEEAKREAGEKESAIIINASEAAEVAGRSIQGVKRAVTEKKLKQQPDGTFLRVDVEKWAGKAKPPTDIDDEIKRLKRDILKTKRDVLRGKLVSRDEMIRQFTARCYEFRSSLLHLSRRIGAKLAEKSKKTLTEVQRIVDTESRDILERYSRPIEINPETAK